MSLRKRRSCEYRHCWSVWQESQSLWIAARCLDKSSIKTSWASLPAKQAITVGFCSGFNVKLLHDWTNFDLQSLCQSWSVEHICLTPALCLSLTNTRQDTSQQVTHYGSVQSGICGRQRPQKWTNGGSYSRRPLPSLLNPPPFSLPPYPLPVSTPATKARNIWCFLVFTWRHQIQTRRLSLLPSFYFHVVWQHLKTLLFQTNFRFKRFLRFAIPDDWISTGFCVTRHLADSQESSFVGWKH